MKCLPKWKGGTHKKSEKTTREMLGELLEESYILDKKELEEIFFYNQLPDRKFQKFFEKVF